ncbi:MAG: hypothetical protein GYA57_22075 [Myxococcales bacterium]|nr:hypothetical protein [Myxococcales bacterium]
MHDPTTERTTATDDPTPAPLGCAAPPDDPTAIRGGARVRETIRRQADVLRHPDGFPPRLVFEALAYLYAAYALGSRTARAELEEHLRRHRGALPPSPAVALGMARGFRRLAVEMS